MLFLSYRLAMPSGADNGPTGKEDSTKAHKNAPDLNRGRSGDKRTHQRCKEDFWQSCAKTGEGRRWLGQDSKQARYRQAIRSRARHSRNCKRRQGTCIALPQEGS